MYKKGSESDQSAVKTELTFGNTSGTLPVSLVNGPRVRGGEVWYFSDKDLSAAGGVGQGSRRPTHRQ